MKIPKLKYVIQKHHASHLHYDFRLELDGVAKSWAVPKEPPIQAGIKRLAVQVEDHPVEYMDFEGTIEEGYGKGTVEIWDTGTWEPQSVQKNKIVANIHGEKLRGRYTIVHYKDENWLLFKSAD